MITAVIQHKNDTLVVELPKSNTDLQIKLLSIGVRTLPQNIKLFGGEDAEVDVQLASGSRVGQHLCRLFNTENSLGDVNTTAYLVQTADESIKTDLEHDIYYDQYSTAAELINDIKDRTLALGPVKMSLYFPLTGNIDEGDGNPFTVGDSFLYDYRYDINDLIEEYQDRDVEDILEYFDGDASAKAKLVSAQWSTEIVDGTLYGKVDLRLREELTESELTSVKDWITGQNSDGAFECLEDHPIDSEDGKLSISLWHGGNDYFVSNGERPKYYVENNHPAIIDAVTFGRVQEELARRSGKPKTKQVGTKTEQGKYSSKYAMTELLVCGECKTPYRRCTWTVKGQKKIVWRCINRLDFGKKYCHNSPTVEESILQRAVMRAIMETAQQNLGVLQTLKVHIGMGLQSEQTEDNSMELQIRIAEIDAEFKAMLAKISTDTVDAFDEEKAKRLMDEKARLQQQLGNIRDGQLKREQTQSRLDDIYTILDGLKNRPMEYDEQIVRQLLECITVDSKEQITVIFVGGLKVVQPLID